MHDLREHVSTRQQSQPDKMKGQSEDHLQRKQTKHIKRELSAAGPAECSQQGIPPTFRYVGTQEHPLYGGKNHYKGTAISVAAESCLRLNASCPPSV